MAATVTARTLGARPTTEGAEPLTAGHSRTRQPEFGLGLGAPGDDCYQYFQAVKANPVGPSITSDRKIKNKLYVYMEGFWTHEHVSANDILMLMNRNCR